MASSQMRVAQICEALKQAGEIRARKMFGEYGLYCDDVFIGVICDDTLFVKPTEPGRAFAPRAELASAHPRAKPSLKISEQADPEWLCQLVRLTRDALRKPG